MGIRIYGRGYSTGPIGAAFIGMGYGVYWICKMAALVMWWYALVVIGTIWAIINATRGITPAWPIKKSLWGFRYLHR